MHGAGMDGRVLGPLPSHCRDGNSIQNTNGKMGKPVGKGHPQRTHLGGEGGSYPHFCRFRKLIINISIIITIIVIIIIIIIVICNFPEVVWFGGPWA